MIHVLLKSKGYLDVFAGKEIWLNVCNSANFELVALSVQISMSKHTSRRGKPYVLYFFMSKD